MITAVNDTNCLPQLSACSRSFLFVVAQADFLSLDMSSSELREVQGVILDPSCSGSGTCYSRMDHLLPSQAQADDCEQSARLRALAGFQVCTSGGLPVCPPHCTSSLCVCCLHCTPMQGFALSKCHPQHKRSCSAAFLKYCEPPQLPGLSVAEGAAMHAGTLRLLLSL